MFYYVILPLALLILIAYKFIFSKKKRLNLPPTPPHSLPIIGHHRLIKPPVHRLFHRLAKAHGPIFYLRLGTAEEGIVVGGGCILLRIASKVDAIKGTLAEDKEKKALSCLLNLTAKNAGVYGSVVIESVLSSCNQKNCHNNATDTYKDLFLAVIIDPTKSMLQPWLRHFFMSDCVVVEIKEPESAFPAGKPMDNSETLSMNDPLTAVNNATQASDRLHQGSLFLKLLTFLTLCFS
ncbi:hypothetical protein DY000_02036345 [Brassica cretica]|uniref:Uncharacterized protein n=1 Tax=Brassica cretica TaxID=69181 RepID=A0ABQ7B9X9_BRACR|nr:hypothetical protein DY000_02036345 [Brassica cretica]